MADWREIFTGSSLTNFEAMLPGCLKSQPWFFGRTKTIRHVAVRELFLCRCRMNRQAALVFLQVEYVETSPELYALPLAFAPGGEAGPLRESGMADLVRPDGSHLGVLGKAFTVPAFSRALFGLVRNRERLHNAQAKSSRHTRRHYGKY